MPQTFDSRRLRHQRQMDARLTADHRQIARLIAGLVLRAATARDDKGTPIIPPIRAQRDALKAAIWEQVLKPYYIGAGTDALLGPVPQSPYARLLVEGIEKATRIQAERQTAIVKRLCKDDVVTAWLTGPRNVLAVREMAPMGYGGRILELTAINVGQPFTPQPARGSGRTVDVSRLVSPRGMYEPFHQFVDPNGYRLSDRVWTTSINVRSRIDLLLDTEIARGTSAVTIAGMLEPFMTPGGRLPKTQTPYGTQGSYAARRLARTEITAAAGRATVNAAAANPFVERLQWRTSGSHPKQDACDRNARGGPNGDGIYAIGSVPRFPNHTHCLCSLLPVPTGSTADLVQTLRADIQAARGSFVDAASGGNAARGRALQGLLNPDYLTQAILSGNLEQAVTDAAIAAQRMAVRVGKPKPPPIHAPVAPAPKTKAAKPAAIDYTTISIDDMKTVAQVEKWAEARYPTINFDFAETHINNIKPTMRQFDKLAQQYPEVAARLEYVGTYQGQGAPGNTWTDGIAHASSDGKRIGLNPKWYNSRDGLQDEVTRAHDINWLDADGSIEATLSHEFGHQVENWLLATQKNFLPYASSDGLGMVSDTVSLFNKAFSPTTRLSQYAVTTNSAATAPSWRSAEDKVEAWAEAFAAIQHKPRSKWPLYVKQLDTLIKEIADPSRWSEIRFTGELFGQPDKLAAAREAVAAARKKLGL